MSRRFFLTVGVGTALAAGAWAKAHIGPELLYPKAAMTPGRAETLSPAELTAHYADHCKRKKRSCTYAQSHRHVPAWVRRRVYENYRVPLSARNARHGEIDHLHPVCAGGSNHIANLWYQPADGEWKGYPLGYREKDVLEAWVCREIKAGRLDPAVAYDRITGDWVAYYLAAIPYRRNAKE